MLLPCITPDDAYAILMLRCHASPLMSAAFTLLMPAILFSHFHSTPPMIFSPPCHYAIIFATPLRHCRHADISPRHYAVQPLFAAADAFRAPGACRHCHYADYAPDFFAAMFLRAMVTLMPFFAMPIFSFDR